ncbi:caspase-3-like [Ornithodoros turicata]|uniref:caspase-3-like n=1 Tax=Ornithodoros turicata TaxID=34597 RepID=UPI003139AC66
MSVSQDALPYKEPSGSLRASYSSISTPVYTEGTGRSTGLDERYELNSFVRNERKNTCLIVNIEAFDTLPYRNGAAEDTKKIHALFDELGFTCMLVTANGVVNYADVQEATGRPGNRLTRRDIHKAIKDVKEKIDSESDIFACWIMSHGKRGHIVGSDNEEVYLDEILQEFTEKGCEKLKGKPKLFFVQACQAPGEDEEDNDKCWDYDITPYADFFVGFSTPSGYVSYRDTIEGSFYIKAMDKVFRSCLERSSSVDFTRVMTLVGNDVAINFKATRDDERVVTQMPCYVSSLVKRIFLSKAAPRTSP